MAEHEPDFESAREAFESLAKSPVEFFVRLESSILKSVLYEVFIEGVLGEVKIVLLLASNDYFDIEIASPVGCRIGFGYLIVYPNENRQGFTKVATAL